MEPKGAARQRLAAYRSNIQISTVKSYNYKKDPTRFHGSSYLKGGSDINTEGWNPAGSRKHHRAARRAIGLNTICQLFYILIKLRRIWFEIITIIHVRMDMSNYM